MPVTDKILTSDGIIHYWETNETSDELIALCNSRAITAFNDIQLESRRKQMMVTALLHHELFPATQLNYAPTGKPYVTSEDKISISHSGNIVIMMKSKSECGVDIEHIHPRIRKVRHKFLSDSELLITADLPDRILAQFWTAKEAMFKVSGSDAVFMRSNIFVDEIDNDQATAVLIDGAQKIIRRIRYHYKNEMVIAWTEIIHEG